MSSNQLLGAFVVVGAMVLAGVAGCGGSGGGDEDPPSAEDFALGDGDVSAQWSSSSTELIHSASDHALYYLDINSVAGSTNIIAIDVESGADSTLETVFFEASKLRLTADEQDLYILESGESAQTTDGFPDLARYDIGGDFTDPDFINLDDDKIVSDFAVTNNSRVVVASYEIPASGVTPSAQWLSLYSGESGALFDAETFMGVSQQLTLNRDQVTLFDQVMISNGYHLKTVSVGTESIVLSDDGNLLLGFGADNTYEPEGDRIFRSNGTVWDDDETLDLGTGYDSIEFDLNKDRVVILVSGSNGFIIRYFDLDTLELLSEQPLPTIDEAAGMSPVKLFVDDSDLYVVYREVSSDVTKDYVLVEFSYP